MCDDDSVIWPSTLPPCPVAKSIVQSSLMAWAERIDRQWKMMVYGDASEQKIVGLLEPPDFSDSSLFRKQDGK